MSSDLFFDNVGGSTQDYIYVTDCAGIQLGTGDYEIEWTMKMDFTLSGNYTRVWGLGDYPQPYLSMSVEKVGSNRAMYFWHSAGGNSYDNLHTLDGTTYNNAWTTFKLNRTSGLVTLYVNDVSVNAISCTHNSTAPTGKSLYIGSQYTSTVGTNAPTDGFYGYLRYFSWKKAGVQQFYIDNYGAHGTFANNIFYVNNNGSPTAVPCFNKGTQILCIDGEEETYIPIEKIVAGTTVKTYKHGAKAVKCIGHGQFINDVKNPKKCMFKMEKTESMPDDLILTGGHAVLVDQASKGLQFKIDDKYLSFVENNKSFVSLDNTETYTYYNFCMEGDGDVRYGVWANGVLCETPSEKQFRTFTYDHIDE